MKIKQFVFSLLLSLISGFGFAQVNTVSPQIRLNQIGFFPNGTKTAIIIGATAQQFYLIDAQNPKDTVYHSVTVPSGYWKSSEEETYKADFSTFTKMGKFKLFVKDVGTSYPFEIAPEVYLDAAKASLKSFYYQRTAIALLPEFAGKFARKLAHPDTKVLVHNSAASTNRPKGTIISSPKGWYDAGDYNKYIVNSGISTYTLLALYADFPKWSKALNVNIPESKNAIPDLLDEVNWNLRWMFTMQDPQDGGVYHKLTNAKFYPFIMPDLDTTPRYVVQKSTAATLDFAALMAYASRIYKKYPKELPGLADSCKVASIKAYKWALKNPKVYYDQKKLQNPEIKTGAYGDTNVQDELFWASCELYITTHEESYLQNANFATTYSKYIGVPTWSNVGMLGIYSLLEKDNQWSSKDKIFPILEELKKQFIAAASKMQDAGAKSAYGMPFGVNPSDFVWGSNAVASNQGMFLIKAYQLSQDKKLLESAQANLDYLMGRNALSFSFLTGFGGASPQNIHHRPSFSDGISAPIPGFLAGGPNPGQQDLGECNGIVYPTKIPAKSYIDVQCAFASNEVAINWNAPFVYLIGSIEALK